MLKPLTRITTYPTVNDVPYSNLFLFAIDHKYSTTTDNTVSKRFFRMNYIELFQRLFITPPEHRIFYEYVNSHNRKIHADIEWEFDDKDRSQIAPLFDQVINSVCIGIRTELSQMKVDYRPERDCIILSSHGPNKFSVHIIINNFYFNSLSNLKSFMTKIQSYIPPNLQRYVNPSKQNPDTPDIITYSNTLDMSIYTSARQFRLIWNTKIDKNRYLEVDPLTPITARCPRDSDDPPQLSPELQKLRLFEACLISFTYNCQLLPDFITSINKPSKSYIDITSDQEDYIINAFNTSTYTNVYRLGGKYKTNSFYLYPITKPYHCDCHQRTHDSNNALLCYSSNMIDGVPHDNAYIKCLAGGPNCIIPLSNNISDIIIEEDDTNDDGIFTCFNGTINARTGEFTPYPTIPPINNNINTNNDERQRIPANPIINNQIPEQLLTQQIPDSQWDEVGPTSKILLNNNALIINNSKISSTINNNNYNKGNVVDNVLISVEGQIVAANKNTNIESFLNDNTKYIGGSQYPVNDIYNSYELYRDGKGTSYNLPQGHFGRALTKLGHTINQKKIKSNNIRVVTLNKPLPPLTSTINPVEVLAPLASNAGTLLSQALNPSNNVVDNNVIVNENPLSRPLNQNIDVRNFMDDYLVEDTNAYTDLNNLSDCFDDYCKLNNIIRRQFGKKRLINFMVKYFNCVVEDNKLIGYSCKKDIELLKNIEKEDGYRRIWQYNTTPYTIGWHNGTTAERYCKLASRTWSNINVITGNDEIVPDIDTLIEQTHEYQNALSDSVKEILSQINTRKFLLNTSNREVLLGEIEQLSASIDGNITDVKKNISWCLSVRSTFATQKTRNLVPYITDNPNMRVLIVLPRIALTTEYMMNNLGFTIYN